MAQCESLLVVLSVRRERRRVARRLQCEREDGHMGDHAGTHMGGQRQEWTDGDRVIEWKEQ